MRAILDIVLIVLDLYVWLLIASAILKKMLIETKGDFPKAIGYYHSHTPALAVKYRDMVLGRAEKYVQKMRPSGPSLPPTPSYRVAGK